MLGTDSERASTFAGLASLASHLRSHLGRSLRLRLAPEISFQPDEGIAYAARIDTLLEGLKRPPADAPEGDAGDEESPGR